MHARHSLPHQFTGGSSFLQDIAYSAQQALDQSSDADLVPVDPALQAFSNSDYQSLGMATRYQANGDTVISSVEYPPTDPMLVDGIELNHRNCEPHGPSIEPLTPGPPPHNDTQTLQNNTNGYLSKPLLADADLMRHFSTPVSPRHVSAPSPIDTCNVSPATTTDNNLLTNNDIPPPPITPIATTATTTTNSTRTRKTPRSSKTPKSTPGARRRDSKEHIKLENGISMSTGMGVNGLGNIAGLFGNINAIDPNLDQASIDLIKQLQQEDLGLRRRSR